MLESYFGSGQRIVPLLVQRIVPLLGVIGDMLSPVTFVTLDKVTTSFFVATTQINIIEEETIVEEKNPRPIVYSLLPC